MFVFTQDLLDNYRPQDVVLKLLESNCQSRDTEFKSHKWLLDSLAKRMIYMYMYQSLFCDWATKRLKVLDVGGGYCSATRVFLKNHDYFLLDPMYADEHLDLELRSIEDYLEKKFWVKSDWYRTPLDSGHAKDIVIANDVFPNVDQRLDLFIEKFVPVCKEIRLSLTYYNQPKFYLVERMEGDETFCILAWTGGQVREVLEKYRGRIPNRCFDMLTEDLPSIFPNGRQVCMVTIQGDK